MGRPKVAILSSDLIAGAAMDLVNATGGFTIPELARTLKVSPSSLYNHVSGREQIVELLRERAMSEVRLPDLGGPWPEVIADIVRSYYRSYARYPRLIPLMTAYPVQTRQAVAMYDALAATLTRAGFTAEDTLRTITLIDSFVLGSALDAAAPAEPWGDAADAGPELAAALTAGAAMADRAGDAFEYGLAVLLRGLSQP
ncbi:TetR/AcrR family transcriptional regulator C-terminal domain-containing protein [Mycobacterium sp. MBM]|nr:TetR/AcrR family transcriptional regulator C-terminal domain-containing protein [Mycobacterium sp. MBM]